MGEFKVTPREVAVLRAFHSGGDLAIFELKASMSWNSPRIYSVVNNLVNKNLLQKNKAEKRQKMGRPSTVFAITTPGINLLKVVDKSREILTK